MKHSHLVREIVEAVALIIFIILVVHFVIQSYQVGDPSMQKTFTKGQNVLVNKMAYLFRSPERGDVIVFHYPQDTAEDYIKRIIAIPGDKVQIDRTHVWVNGVQLNEQPYVSTPANPIAGTWTLEPDQYFVVSDTRTNGFDSRTWGPLNKQFIVGKVVAIFWPLTNLSFINTFPDVFTAVRSR